MGRREGYDVLDDISNLLSLVKEAQNIIANAKELGETRRDQLLQEWSNDVGPVRSRINSEFHNLRVANSEQQSIGTAIAFLAMHYCRAIAAQSAGLVLPNDDKPEFLRRDTA